MNLRVSRTFYFSKEQTQCFREKKIDWKLQQKNQKLNMAGG